MASPGVVINSVHIVMLQGPSARMTSSNLCFGRIPPSGEGRLARENQRQMNQSGGYCNGPSRTQRAVAVRTEKRA